MSSNKKYVMSETKINEYIEEVKSAGFKLDFDEFAKLLRGEPYDMDRKLKESFKKEILDRKFGLTEEQIQNELDNLTREEIIELYKVSKNPYSNLNNYEFKFLLRRINFFKADEAALDIINKEIKDKLISELKFRGYNLDEFQIKQRLERLTEESIEILWKVLDKNYDLINNIRFERLLSDIDFFGYKESNLIDKLKKEEGTLYFRVPNIPSNQVVSMKYDDIRMYESFYTLVVYENKKYLIGKRAPFLQEEIICVSDKAIEEEFITLEEFLATFEYVGKTVYRDEAMPGELKNSYEKNKYYTRYVFYKNDSYFLMKVKSPSRRGFLPTSCALFSYCPDDGNWKFEDSNLFEFEPIENLIKQVYSKRN